MSPLGSFGRFTARPRIALRLGKWKIARQDPKKKWELFNLAEDPFEAHDLADARPDVVAQLTQRLAAEQALDQQP